MFNDKEVRNKGHTIKVYCIVYLFGHSEARKIHPNDSMKNRRHKECKRYNILKIIRNNLYTCKSILYVLLLYIVIILSGLRERSEENIKSCTEIE